MKKVWAKSWVAAILDLGLLTVFHVGVRLVFTGEFKFPEPPDLALSTAVLALAYVHPYKT